MSKIGVVYYNMGNIASVINAIAVLGFECEIIKHPDKISSFDKIILPGVGAFPDAMNHLKEESLDEAIKEHAKTKPIFGVCLGMQLLFDKSYEHNETNGLGLISGEVVRFQEEISGKIPQMGWNKINIKQDSILVKELPDNHLYFVHSYYVVPKDINTVVATTNYGVEFASIVQKDNIYGIQPHPEKSSNCGLKILKNFLEL